MSQRSPRPAFGDFAASELSCDRCGRAQPVRRRLLLVLPGGDEYVYQCAVCGREVGEQRETGPERDPPPGEGR